MNSRKRGAMGQDSPNSKIIVRQRCVRTAKAIWQKKDKEEALAQLDINTYEKVMIIKRSFHRN